MVGPLREYMVVGDVPVVIRVMARSKAEASEIAGQVQDRGTLLVQVDGGRPRRVVSVEAQFGGAGGFACYPTEGMDEEDE